MSNVNILDCGCAFDAEMKQRYIKCKECSKAEKKQTQDVAECLVGQSFTHATDICKKMGMSLRIGSINKREFVMTMDIRNNRITVVIDIPKNLIPARADVYQLLHENSNVANHAQVIRATIG